MRTDKDEMLQEAASQFRHYAELHAAKGTKEGREKAEVNLQYAMNCEAAIKGPTEDLVNDLKYKIVDGRLVNRVNGVAIPEHEPVFIFRARDRHAIAVLRFYEAVVLNPDHRRAIEKSIDKFRNFMKAFPDRMKEPGVPHDPRPKEPVTITRYENAGDSMSVTAYWSDGVSTSVDFRNFRWLPNQSNPDEMFKVFFERRFGAPLEEVNGRLA